MPLPLAAKIPFLLFLIGFTVLMDAFIYWLNQYAVKKTLEPRRKELENLLAELETENHSSIMKTKKPLGALLLVSATCIIAVIAHAALNATPDTSIEAICKKHGVPALAVVVVKDGQICEREVAGVRKSGDAAPVTTNDVFHIGSCTKSMTATLTAMLIEEGKLKWDTTIVEIFPELRGKMDRQYEAVTIEQLLHHWKTFSLLLDPLVHSSHIPYYRC